MTGYTDTDRQWSADARDQMWGARPKSGGAIETGGKMDVVEARNNLIDLLQAECKEKDRRIAKLEQENAALKAERDRWRSIAEKFNNCIPTRMIVLNDDPVQPQSPAEANAGEGGVT